MVILLVTYLLEALLYLFIAYRVYRTEVRLGHSRKFARKSALVWAADLDKAKVYATRSFSDVCRWKLLMSAVDF